MLDATATVRDIRPFIVVAKLEAKKYDDDLSDTIIPLLEYR